MTAIDGRFGGRTAVVTGGASGLGEATVARLAAAGARVVVADVDEPAAQRVAGAVVKAGGTAEAVAVDVTNEEDVRRMVGAATGGNGDGRLDVLVCSAAVEVRASLADTSDDEWQRVIDVNLKGPFLCLKHAIPSMARSGGGSAILLGSVLGAIGSPGYAAYCASKGALVNLAKQAAIEHAPDNVRVNVVSPSASETGLFLKMVEQAPDPEAIKRMVAERTPMQRLGTADDVCESIMFLAGDESSYISGAVLPLDGGLAARRM
jgi:meso-butanediol dehydrogenase / (S,S)-butanediol dehydrogenase / diacetyl reductase